MDEQKSSGRRARDTVILLDGCPSPDCRRLFHSESRAFANSGGSPRRLRIPVDQGGNVPIYRSVRDSAPNRPAHQVRRGRLCEGCPARLVLRFELLRRQGGAILPWRRQASLLRLLSRSQAKTRISATVNPRILNS